MELSWQSPWGSETREGWALLPRGGGDGRAGGRSPGYGLEEWVNTERRVSPRRVAPVALRRRCAERETGGGVDEGSMDAVVQRSNQTSSEEEPRTSLFHCILEQRQLRNPDEEMKFLLQRLVVIAHLPRCLADRRTVGVYYEKLNQSLQRSYPGENITGLLLLYPTCVLHVIECSSDVLAAVLQDLRKMEVDPQCSVLEKPRVLLVTHDVPSRLFQHWGCRELHLPTATTMLGEDHVPESTEVLVSQVLSLLLRLGNHLLTASKVQTSQVSPESVEDELPEKLLVPQDVLSQLLQRTELLTPQQYLQTYHTPLHLLIDSGHVFGSHQPTTV
ncbi:testis-expressed protein 47 isoform X2 [Clupea harengus]|uniref:Testis-expressed protein 47 isoform X2 n=1 Tax=Clupea harengus TaxID=7950 RepID=A0A6P8EY24_CLUHA|nr:testis-expressed protein 47 isoform X2 [Clupea harengus]